MRIKFIQNIIDYVRKKDFSEVILKRNLNYKKYIKWLLKFNTESNYRIVKVQNDIITYVGNGVKFLVKAEYPWIALEIFLENVYKIKFEQFDYTKKYTLIDIGCNNGYASLFFAKEHWVKDIYAFELFPETLEFAKKSVSLNKFKIKNKIKFFNYGLANDNTTLMVYSDGRDYANTTKKEALLKTSQNPENIKTFPCNVKKASTILKEMIEKNKIKNIIFKIDVEGAEYDIIEDLSNNYPEIFSKIDIIVGETHLGFDKFTKYLPKEYKVIWKEEHDNGTCPFEIINSNKT